MGSTGIWKEFVHLKATRMSYPLLVFYVEETDGAKPKIVVVTSSNAAYWWILRIKAWKTGPNSKQVHVVDYSFSFKLLLACGMFGFILSLMKTFCNH